MPATLIKHNDELHNTTVLERHRNPSGLRNKVRWILSQMKWDLKNYDTVYNSIVEYPIDTKSGFSWYQVWVLIQYILLPENVFNTNTTTYITFLSIPKYTKEWALKLKESYLSKNK